LGDLGEVAEDDAKAVAGNSAVAGSAEVTEEVDAPADFKKR